MTTAPTVILAPIRYNLAGRVTSQSMQVSLNQSPFNNYSWGPYQVTVSADYMWDNDGGCAIPESAQPRSTNTMPWGV